ncbi:MAG TPA: hypothetical protein VN088_19695 [Nocardioides sp.]|nr:hypothetical protein [Nocardioides sp.]
MSTQGDDRDRDEAACRVCGCTETAACPGGCHWVPDPQMGDLCSACALRAAADEDDCEVCAGGGEECSSCDGSGGDGYGEYCQACGGAGSAVPDHCCFCGSGPYCVSCHRCGAACIGGCRCPVQVQMSDGSVKTL